jgi:peptidoglycan hydrolase FlgJ
MTSPILSSLSPVPAGSAATPDVNNYTDLNALSALKGSPDSPATIKAVSEQVEAMFLQMMLKSMRDATDEIGGEQTSNETGMYQDMFDKQVALTLSKRQDLGIARLFERQLSGGKSSAAAPAASPLPLPHPRSSRVPGSEISNNEPNGQSGGTEDPANLAAHASAFVDAVLPTIKRAAAAIGVNPLGMLAQAALETGWGRRMPRNADGTSSLNLFGVKAGGDWEGARAVADTVEVSGGVATQKRTAFRAYGSIEESVSDFASLLARSPRYREAIAAGGSAQGYIQSIARSGYATDPEYGNKLNQVLNGGTLRAALMARLAKL